MGADFSNRWHFAGGCDSPVTRSAVAGYPRQVLIEAGYREVERKQDADRSLVVAPAGGWVFIGDSAGRTEGGGREAFDALSRAASVLSPVAAVKMSDAAVSAKDVEAIAHRLRDDALRRHVPSAELMLKYLLGKPAKADGQDRVALNEWRLI